MFVGKLGMFLDKLGIFAVRFESDRSVLLSELRSGAISGL